MIKIGTCVKGTSIIEDLPEIIKSGFETVQLYFVEPLGSTNLEELSNKIKEIDGMDRIKISSIGLYGNPLIEDTRKELELCIKNAHLFGAKVVSTFAGAEKGKNVKETIPTFKKVFTELAKLAEEYGVKIGIENAHMYGHWYQPTCNIGFCSRAWEMMFDAVDSDFLGLEWEPSHQIEQFVDIEKQLKIWMPKIVHVHGKDASIDKKSIDKYGAWFGESYCVHRFPGLGDSNWTGIIKILNEGSYTGDIAIEGFHDPVYNGERELEGQINALHYLMNCRKEAGLQT